MEEAGKDFVFVLIDLPHDTSGQSAQVQQQNEKLAEQFGIENFPTVFLADASSMAIYSIGCCLFALAFGAGLPFAIAEIAELDLDGRYVILSVPAVGMGAMIGPGVAGFLYTGESALLVLTLVAMTMIVAAGLMWTAHRNKLSPTIASTE